MRILIVEDEEPLANGLKFNFEQEGYDVVTVGNGTAALEQFQRADRPIDLVILDLMLPDMSGYETCQAIRRIDNQVPILVLSARTLSEDKTLAFDCGTDQYMTKPFALPELLSRVRNLLERRSAVNGEPNRGHRRATTFAFGNVRVDFPKFEVTVGDQRHTLTKMEFDLLRYFIANEGRVLSRAEILENVWRETAQLSTRSIDNFVMRLRKLIEPDSSQPRHLLSIRGAGYRFVAEPDDTTGVVNEV